MNKAHDEQPAGSDEHPRAHPADREQHLRVFDQAHLLVRRMDDVITTWSSGAEKLYGYSKEETIGRVSHDLFRTIFPESKDALAEALSKTGQWQGKLVHTAKDGRRVVVASHQVLCQDCDGNPVAILEVNNEIVDHNQATDEMKRNEARLESLFRISQYRAGSVQEFLDMALDEAIALTDSKIGYIYHYDETRREFTLNTWSKDVMKQCGITDQQTVYQLEKTGIWGEAVRQAKPVIVNDFQAPHPLKKGYPDGHAALYRYMTLPVFIDEQIVGVVGVANKQTDYDSSDVRQLTLLMDSAWKFIERRQTEDALREAEAHKRDFYRKTILAATRGKLLISEPEVIKAVAGAAVATLDIRTLNDLVEARRVARNAAESEGMERVQIRNLLMAVGEATSNVIKHAGEGAMSVHRTDNGLMVIVTDRGSGIDGLNLPDVALTMGYSTAGTGGMGYNMIIASSDKVYLATGPEGTTVAMQIELHTASGSQQEAVSPRMTGWAT